MQVYRTPILTLDPDARAGGGLVEVVKLADAQATVEALQAQLREGEAAYHKVGEYNDHLKQQVEALQRERDEARDFLNTVTNDLNEQAGELSQLQALVRALPVYQRVSIRYEKDEHDFETWRIWTDSNPFAECATEDEANGLKAMLEYRATLDATAPAADTSIIGKCEPPSQWNRNAQVRGDIS